MTTRAGAIALVVFGLVAAACGSGDTVAPRRPASDRPITTTLPPPLDGTVLPVVKEFWHSGFHVELEKAEVWTSKTLLTNRVSHWLTLWGEFENQGEDVAAFDPDMAIVASGVSYANRSGDPPRILPHSAALGKLTFLIPEDIDLESAELVVGAAAESQARIPLGSEGTVVGMPPSDVDLTGQLAMELLDLDFTGVSLRYDLPDLHRQLESGKLALTLQFDVTSRNPGKSEITMDALTLVLPDGSVVDPAAARLGPLPGGEEGITTTDRYVSFVIDETEIGDFALRLALDEPLVGEDEVTQAAFEFSL